MRRIAVVTGTRADWGLLRCVCDAIRDRTDLSLTVLAGGAHLLPPANTIEEVRAAYPALMQFEMQRAGETGRLADAAALGRGVQHLSALFHALAPDIVVVLGDRIEAFAGAAAASVGGIRVAHVHGGDRAEGVADEAMRHAITKLSHMHLAATAASAERIRQMGEQAARVHVIGSPAIDALPTSRMLNDAGYAALGKPEFVFLLHPIGRSGTDESAAAERLLEVLSSRGRSLLLSPNSDPGSDGIAEAISRAQTSRPQCFRAVPHLERSQFIGLLKRPEVRALVGNSSAGLIECAALRMRVLNVGTRQSGRERADNVQSVRGDSHDEIAEALDALLNSTPSGAHPYGDGDAGTRAATVLALADFAVHGLAKHNTY